MMQVTPALIQFAARKKPSQPKTEPPKTNMPQVPAPALLEGKEWSNRYRQIPAGTQVIQTQAEWKNFWQGKMQDQVPSEFNSKQHTAVVIALGARSSGGYGVKITDAKEDNGRFVVKYQETIPQGMATMAITYPSLVKLFPKTKLPVVIEKA
jgi:hypothetical protein